MVTTLAIWLVAVGMADLARAGRDVTSPRRRVGVCAVGVATLSVMWVLGVEHPVWWSHAACVLLMTMWILGSAAAATRGAAGWLTLAAVGLAGGIGFGLLNGRTTVRPWPSRVGDSVLTQFSVEQVLLVTGVILVQWSTANIVVRLFLQAVGVPASDKETTLRGGRILGPLERLFIVTLGAGGATTALAVVVAGKGLLRFPELRESTTSSQAASELTEYFLIGSLSSWTFAAGGVALIALSRG